MRAARSPRPWPSAAGVAAGTVYKHFAGKVELVAEVFRSIVTHEVDVVRERGRPADRRSTGPPRSSRPSPRRALKSPRRAYVAARRTGRPADRRAAAGVPRARSATSSPTPSNAEWPTASCRRRTRRSSRPPWSARSARRSSARSPPALDDPDLVPTLITFTHRAIGRQRRCATHEVTNQVPPAGRARHHAPTRRCSRGCTARAPAGPRPRSGSSASSATASSGRKAGRLANDHPPVLRTHDRYGHRVDEVEYLPQYHDLMRTAVEHGLHGAPWADDRPGAHVARAAKVIVVGGRRRRPPLPDLDDLRRRAGAADDAGAGRRLRAAAHQPRVRPGPARPAGQARADRRHVDDREAGRLRRPRQHHPRRAAAPTAATG